MLALGVLTACTKTTENANDGNISAEGEDLPDTENTEGGNAENAEDEEGEGIGANDDAGDASSGETELMGMIENVPPDSDDTFIIAKLVVEEVDGMDLVSTDENDTKVTVVTVATVFYQAHRPKRRRKCRGERRIDGRP